MSFRALPQRGFSLMEMAVVLVILSAVLGIFITSVTTFSGHAGESLTRSKQAAIKAALMSYLRANSTLPCPDVSVPGAPPTGIAGVVPPAATTGCPQTFGGVPFQTLGLSRDAVLDSQGNFFTYVVTTVANPPTSPTTDWFTLANFRSGATGAIRVDDKVLAPVQGIVAVIISHGANGSGALTIRGTRNAPPAGADEFANATGCVGGVQVCFARQATDNDAAPGGAFDDIVLSISADELMEPLFAQGVRKSPRAEFEAACEACRSALVAEAFAHQTGAPGSKTYSAGLVLCNVPDPYSMGGAAQSIPLTVWTFPAATTGVMRTYTAAGPAAAPLSCSIRADELLAVLAKTGF